MKKKVLVITGTRAEYGYLRPLLREILKSKKLSLRLLVTGMHTLKKHGMTIQDIQKDGMPISAIVPIREHDSMLQSLATEIRGIERFCKKEKPDMMVVIADRDEPFAGAIVAGHLGIPLIHLAGGDATGYVVDEPIRHAISKFAHVHCTWTKKTAQRLHALGEESWRIHITGSTSFDDIRESPIDNHEEVAARLGLDAKVPWLLFVQHPTPLDPVPFQQQIRPSLAALKKAPGQIIVISPNSDTGSGVFMHELKTLQSNSNVKVFPSLPHTTYLSLLKHSAMIIGNSSSGVAEAGFFGTPAVNIGGRQAGREHGENVIHTPYDELKISSAMRRAISPSFQKKAKDTKHPFDRGHASKRITRILESLTINERLLHKRMPL